MCFNKITGGSMDASLKLRNKKQEKQNKTGKKTILRVKGK